MKKKTVLLGSSIFIIFVILSAGITYAYLTLTASNNVSGNLYEFRVSMTSTTIKKSTKLVPIYDSNITNMMKNSCSYNGYEVCSLYSFTLKNNGSSSQTLHPYILTNSSTYTTSNLKARLYTYASSTYTAASDILTLSNTSSGISDFKLNSSSLTKTLASNGSQTYYLVIWISDTGTTQNDQNKTFKGSIYFESTTYETENLTSDVDT